MTVFVGNNAIVKRSILEIRTGRNRCNEGDHQTGSGIDPDAVAVATGEADRWNSHLTAINTACHSNGSIFKIADNGSYSTGFLRFQYFETKLADSSVNQSNLTGQ